MISQYALFRTISWVRRGPESALTAWLWCTEEHTALIKTVLPPYSYSWLCIPLVKVRISWRPPQVKAADWVPFSPPDSDREAERHNQFHPPLSVLTQHPVSRHMQTYKWATAVVHAGGGEGMGALWYHFHHLLSKTNPLLVPVEASMGSFQLESPTLELCLWPAWSVWVPISQFRRTRLQPSYSVLLQLHTTWICAQQMNSHYSQHIFSMFPSLRGSRHAITKWCRRVQAW